MLSLIVATRGRPRQALGVIESARLLAAKPFELVVCVDEDDYDSIAELSRIPGVAMSIGHRPVGLGAVWNRGARLSTGSIIVPMVDDLIIATPGWDEAIEALMANGFENRALGVLAWNDIASPGQCSLPIITREWFELAGLYDERFPFWFYDTCVDEVWSFVTGQRVTIVPQLVLSGRKGKTARMHDLRFWWDFFGHTRVERLAIAKGLREVLGLSLPQIKLEKMLMACRDRDRKALETVEVVEAVCAVGGAPTAEYLKAKRLAEELMAEAA